MERNAKVKQITLIILFSFILITTTLNFFYLNVLSSSINDDSNSNYMHALQTAPKGLKWGDNNFDIANFSNNSVQIVKPTNENKDTTSIIKMTNGTYQVGGVWGNKDTHIDKSKDINNYFDISHNQTASMWLYFGVYEYYLKDKDGNYLHDNYGNYIQTSIPGDGMAFVIHNSKKGKNAIAMSADGIPVNGQSMGVWGADWNKNETDHSKIAATAIDNSWALEFDTFINNLTDKDKISGEGVSFDASSPANAHQHIASNFPGLPSTYINRNNGTNYFVMHHNSFNAVDHLVDNKWHHVTIKWTPAPEGTTVGTMSYFYDDKDPTTGAKNDNPIESTDIPVDTTNFNLKDGTKLYWGFTGSTGK